MRAYDDTAEPGQAGPDAAEDELRVEVRPGGDCVLVTVAGELDIETLAPAREAFTRALREHPVTVADLAGVTFCDSSGLGMLLQARANALAVGGRLRLAAMSPSVRRLLELTGAAAAFGADATAAAVAEAR
ncbi:STAS domain-containing protein [Kitasatospora sp. NPDC101801]|uniref:STAS domain-containing protein n=1 Tax=Kitasatospora sp. NPDC101801 TaxID=3364103 RepID=UPI003803F00E